jgi:malate permease and related proteins
MISILSLLGMCLALGVLARRSDRFPPQTVPVLNSFIIAVALPSLVLRVVHKLEFHLALLAAAASPWVIFVVAVALFRGVGARVGLKRESIAALVLTGGLSNTAFVGLPMAEALLGREGLAVAVVVDQLGTFLVLATLATLFATRAAAGEDEALRPAALLRKVVVFPPFIALVLALVLRPLSFPAWVDTVLERLGSTLTPLALFSVGFQLQLRGLRARAGALALGLGFKLVLAPALVVLALWALPVAPIVREATIMQNAMAPMVSGAILAAEHKLDPELAALMVGFGIPLSFLTVMLWMWLV